MKITQALQGKLVACVASNGTALSIRCHDRSEINIEWVDDNGVSVKGTPVIKSTGFRMRMSGLSALVERSMKDIQARIYGRVQ